MNTQYLEEIGLTQNEIKVYLALLEISPTTTGPLIDKSKINHSKIYLVLEKLIEKGLASYIIQGKVKKYSAASPERIKDYLAEKKRNVEAQEEEFEKILPQLNSIRKLAKDNSEAEIYKGWKGMETAYRMIREHLKEGDENYIFGASTGEAKEQTKRFFSRHIQEMIKKKIKQKIIFNEEARDYLPVYKQHPKLLFPRHLDHNTPAEINIWLDRTMIIILKKEPIVIIITDNAVADSFRAYFEVMWASAKP